MRKFVQKQLLNLLSTVQEGIQYLTAAPESEAAPILEGCRLAIQQMMETISDSESASMAVSLEKLQAAAADLDGCLTPNRLHMALQRLRSVQDRLNREPIHYEIVFLPYKYAMWDCMESVWLAAKADPNCECHVVPIPYYDRRADESFGTMHYEGQLFPAEVQAVDYRSYDLAARRPDVVYIHNPYDEYNRVTSIDPRFYSHELKKYTDMLVYIPYYVTGPQNSDRVVFYSAYHHADYCVAQSEEMKRGYLYAGLPEQKILTLGSPKFDRIINHPTTEIPEQWRVKLHGQTAFLVNTSLVDLLAHNERWLVSIQSLLQSVLNISGCAVIWRPHPLMEATLQSMRPQQLPFYQKMKEELLKHAHFVMDQSGDFLQAFDASDALISDTGSLQWLYGATGKPVLCLTGCKAEHQQVEYKIIDDTEFYFLQDGFSVDAFLAMTKAGRDQKQQQRMATLKASTANLDGTAGEKIYRTVLDKCKSDFGRASNM